MQGPRDSRRSVGGDAPVIGLDQGTTKASLCEVGLRPGHKSRSRFGIWLSRDLVCAQGSAESKARLGIHSIRLTSQAAGRVQQTALLRADQSGRIRIHSP